MKRALVIILIFAANISIAQTNFSKVKVKTKEEVKEAEPQILEACDYMLSHKYDDKDYTFLSAQSLLIKWMEKTEYTFMLNEKMMECCTKKNNLLGIYLAALAKGQLAYESDFAKNGVLEFVKYVTNEVMRVKKIKSIKTLIADKEADNLSEYYD